MTVIPVRDLRDPALALYAHLTDAALLGEHGVFVAEGRLVVERVLNDSRFVVRSLLVNAAALEALRPVLQALPDTVLVYLAATSQFEALTGFNLHRGCLALVERPADAGWRDAVQGCGRVVVLEGVTNADNVGSVFRNAAAFGAGAVLLDPACCDPFYRKAVRTSMGTVLRMPVARLRPWPAALLDLRDAGFQIAALTPGAPSVALADFASASASLRVALLVGTEGPGLSAAALALADVRVRIPMASGVDSLNLSVAAAVVLARLADEPTRVEHI